MRRRCAGAERTGRRLDFTVTLLLQSTAARPVPRIGGTAARAAGDRHGRRPRAGGGRPSGEPTGPGGPARSARTGRRYRGRRQRGVGAVGAGPLRRRARRHAHAEDRRLRADGRDPGARGGRQPGAHADHRGDRKRHARGGRALLAGGHGCVSRQAGDHRANSAPPWAVGLPWRLGSRRRRRCSIGRCCAPGWATTRRPCNRCCWNSSRRHGRTRATSGPALAAADLQKVLIAAHNLRGGALSVGANALAQGGRRVGIGRTARRRQHASACSVRSREKCSGRRRMPARGEIACDRWVSLSRHRTPSRRCSRPRSSRTTWRRRAVRRARCSRVTERCGFTAT